jgi:lytic cellulose monooxygenase (C1-hydroxylating)
MVIDAGHKGPVLAYMAKVASATGPAPQQGWFKIYHDGLTSDGKWAVDRLIAKKGRVDVKIPTCLQDGDYLLRGELIALHGAGGQGGARELFLDGVNFC